jgi:hypothetical protein
MDDVAKDINLASHCEPILGNHFAIARQVIYEVLDSGGSVS